MHISLANQSTITFHPSREAAAKLAASNQAMDDDWQYVVEQAQMGFFVAIYDGVDRVGTL